MKTLSSRAPTYEEEGGNTLASFKSLIALMGLIITLAPLGCSSTPPLEQLQTKLASAPDYSIILEDMQESGTFVPIYYHKYRIVQGERAITTDWLKVSKSDYQTNKSFLGMTLVSKTASGVNITAHPPGYGYVGNSQYGSWQTGSGGSFWMFYGQYALMRDMLGMGRGPIFRRDYDTYQTHRTQRRPYYGPKQGGAQKYGTQGTVTRQTKPTFFDRRTAKDRMKRDSFQRKFQRRAGRSSFPSRGGGMGFGK